MLTAPSGRFGGGNPANRTFPPLNAYPLGAGTTQGLFLPSAPRIGKPLIGPAERIRPWHTAATLGRDRPHL